MDSQRAALNHEPAAMKRTLLCAAAGLASAAYLCVKVEADATSAPMPGGVPPLIVVDDRGGVSALPYYQALKPQADGQSHTPSPPPVSRVAGSQAESAMLPVRSVRLTPGDEPGRVIRAPGLTPLFLIGDDPRSRAWLNERRATLQQLNAVGFVVNVETVEALAALRRLAPGLMLSPVSGDDLAQRLGLRHYPVLITATGIEP